MQNSCSARYEDSIASTLGMLYERKARGTTLMRVLRDYQRFKATKAASPGSQLELLRLRRAAVDQLIRSIEAYSDPEPTDYAHR